MKNDWQLKLAQQFTQLCDYNPKTGECDDCYQDVKDFIADLLKDLEREVEELPWMKTSIDFRKGEQVTMIALDDVIKLLRRKV
jgi:hypothetical protein